jgi:hypothetical protein
MLDTRKDGPAKSAIHDVAEREFDYTAGAENALTLAEQQG